ncbi:MAG: hypothetical protein LBV06_06420 [Propionibacteriaceae bacterium]|nr:hypothetical protein [Propionibacteriaceae bacterium]
MNDEAPREPISGARGVLHKYGGWIVAAIIFVLAVGSGYRYFSTPAPVLPRDATGAVTQATTIAISNATIGDCIESLPADEKAAIDKVRFVPCRDAHQVVILGATKTTETGKPEAAQAAAAECVPIAESVTGQNPAAADVRYRLTILPPGGQLGTYLCLADYAPDNAPALDIPR